MRKKIQIIFILFITSLSLNAQIKINGIIRDAETGDALAGATIAVENTQLGAISDSKGYYEITNLQNGFFVIKVSYVGYETKSKNFNLASDGKYDFDLYKTEIITEQIVVTASRNQQTIGDIPGRISLLSSRAITATPSQSVDDIFKQTSGIFVSRGSGLITSSVTVNVRGITSNEQGRVLALVDGMPVNKTDGGSVNWNRINSEDVERVEIFKGPGSSIYGNNAMGGVINIITKRQSAEGYHAFAKMEYGSFSTFSQKAGVSGRLNNQDGLYFRVSGFNRTSDGYNTYREAYRDIYTIDSDLKESGVDAKVGYDFNEKTNLLFDFNYYDDERGTGSKIVEENYMKQRNTFGALSFNTEFGGIKLTAGTFYQKEHYLRVTEKYKLSTANVLTSYSLYDVDAARVDFGGNVSLSMPLFTTELTTGIEIKNGSIDGSDVYRTSTDVITNKGDMLFLAAFLQDSYNITDKLSIMAGLRVDYIKFSNGEFILANPTSVSSDMSAFAGPIAEHDWTKITPKFTAQYQFTGNLKAYAAYSRGFRAASLDDLTRAGLISLGFKNPNPNLKPETIDNIELGFNYDIDKKLFVMPSVYYMEGKDFMYYISTGRTVSISGKSKSVIIKDNISKVRFLGADIDIKYFLSANLYANANYTYTDSKILNYTGNTSLEGKELTYTPRHLANFGITYLNSILNGSVFVHYQGKQFTQDDNSETGSVTVNNVKTTVSMLIEDNVTIDCKIWKKFFNLVNASVNIQNIFDVQTLTTYDRVSFGRMISGELSVEL